MTLFDPRFTVDVTVFEVKFDVTVFKVKFDVTVFEVKFVEVDVNFFRFNLPLSLIGSLWANLKMITLTK